MKSISSCTFLIYRSYYLKHSTSQWWATSKLKIAHDSGCNDIICFIYQTDETGESNEASWRWEQWLLHWKPNSNSNGLAEKSAMKLLERALLKGNSVRFDAVRKSSDYIVASILHPKFKLSIVADEHKLQCRQVGFVIYPVSSQFHHHLWHWQQIRPHQQPTRVMTMTTSTAFLWRWNICGYRTF